MERIFNIIKRAVEEFNYEVDMNDTLQNIWDGAENCIREKLDGFDRVEVCVSNHDHTHITYDDGLGMMYECDGQFVSGDQRLNTYYRWDEDDRKFVEIDWYDVKEDDYVLLDAVFDTDGQYIGLIA